MNSYGLLLRTRKAHAIAAVLRSAGATASDATSLDQDARTIAARLAGWSSVSGETWRAVVDALQWDAVCADMAATEAS